MLEKMMGYMMGRMSKDEKEDVMEKMMENFLADMTEEDKKNMMEGMMSEMMVGVDMMEMMPKMMSGMMGDVQNDKMSMMPEMMMGMMPNCLNMMLPRIPVGERSAFVLKMVGILVEQGSAGMSDEDKVVFLSKVIEEIKA